MSDQPMAPSTRHQGVLRISGPQSDSDAGARVDAPADSIGSTHDQVPGGRSVSFSIQYSNIRGLRSNFSSVEHHLASSLPNLLLLSETKLSGNASPDPFNISHYNSPAEVWLNLEILYKVFFLIDFCSPGYTLSESAGCTLCTLERFEKFKMASKMAAVSDNSP